MNKKRLLVVIGAIILLAFVSMQSTVASNPAGNSIEIVSLSTDKDIYHLSEEMDIALSVYSPGDINDVLIKLSGLKGRHGSDLISLSRGANLTSGENEVFFRCTMPSCGCAVSYGNYFINASVIYDDKVIKATHSIVLTSRGKITYVNITVEEAKRIIKSDSEDVILLDVRTGDEYNSAHISGATLIPVSELCNRTEELNKSKQIVVYCRSGHRSAAASGILVENGFKNVYNLLGGINAWEDRGYPVVSTTAPEQPGFEAVFAIAGLLAVAYCTRHKGQNRMGKQ